MFLWLHGACGEARSRGGRRAPGKDGVRRLMCTPAPQHGNFEESQETMKRQLGQLLLLLRVLDPPLCDFLGMCLGGRAGTQGSSESLWNEQPRRCPGHWVLIPDREASVPTQSPNLPVTAGGGLEQTPKRRCVRHSARIGPGSSRNSEPVFSPPALSPGLDTGPLGSWHWDCAFWP